MVELTEAITHVPEIREWVRRAALPSPDTTKAEQKSAVAHFLVQHVGIEQVQQALNAYQPDGEAANDATRDAA